MGALGCGLQVRPARLVVLTRGHNDMSGLAAEQLNEYNLRVTGMVEYGARNTTCV
jgi:hypothetical protein